MRVMIVALAWVFVSFVSIVSDALSAQSETPNPVWQYSQTSQEALTPPGPFELEKLQRRTFDYFWQLADPETGLIPDRYPSQRFCSIAATGFGLTSYTIGVEKGWIERPAAALRVQKTLQFLWELPQGETLADSGYRGFFYHFLDMDSGQRFFKCELSSIDTGLLLAGVLSCESYFDRDTPIEKSIRGLAKKLVDRVEWDWMLTDDGRLGMGWKPESGFLPHAWRGYDEAVLLHIIAAGSQTHPIPASVYEKYTASYQWKEFYQQAHINFGPLFGHQYSQMYIDFRNLQDAANRQYDIDYFENARRATLAQVAYAAENPKGWKGYGVKCNGVTAAWGLTACDGPGGGSKIFKNRQVDVMTYSARGIAANYDVDDGTLAPTAAAGSLPFTAQQSLAAMQYFWESFDGRLVGRYGFFDSYNESFPPPGTDVWINPDYIGIDQGPILIQSVNHQNGKVWQLMQKNPTIQRGMKALDFRSIDPAQ